MISQTAEYALRAITHLAFNAGSPQTNKQISESTHVPMPYLSKVLQSMARAGLIHSQRGLHGGFTLARPAEDLTVYEVLEAVDPVPRIRTCPLGLKSHGVNLCPLHRRLDDAMGLVENAFRESTIADVISEPTASRPLCSTVIQIPDPVG
jgi:Rrf2 family transcriptional regulator, nitric oxide-sensitive transcriptional repressor